MMYVRANVRVRTAQPCVLARRLALKVKAPRSSGIARAGGSVEALKAEIASIQQEAAEVESEAREQQEKCSELMAVVRALEELAISCLDRGDQDRARAIMQEKVDVQGKLEKATGKVKDLITLEVKLEQAIVVKRSKLAEKDPDYTASGDFRDDDAGVRITRGKDGKPTFERTGTVGGDVEPSAPRQQPYSDEPYQKEDGSFQDPWQSSPSRPYSMPAGKQYSAFQQRLPDDDVIRRQYPNVGYVPSVDELLQAGDRKLDDQFLELERKLLEKALRASSDSDDGPSPTMSSASTESRGNVPEASRTFSGSTSSFNADSDARPQDSQSRVVVAEWWTMGQNSLMDGALAELHSDFEPLYTDAGRALIAVTNARIRGQDASPQKILSLISLALRAPAHHTSGIFWGVQTASGAAQLSENVRLAIYGAALQAIIVDLLSGESSMLPEDSLRRGEQGRALLVSLASAIGLRSSVASHYSVQMLCHACRTYLLNATSSLRQAYSSESRQSMEQAETDLKALYNLLSALPMTLPLAMGHTAVAEVTTALRKVMTPVDARRIDKLYRVVCGEDGTSAALRALLEPIFDELE